MLWKLVCKKYDIPIQLFIWISRRKAESSGDIDILMSVFKFNILKKI